MKEKPENMESLAGRRINIQHPHEIDGWCSLLQCDKEDLINAVLKIGNSAKMVDDFLILNRRKKTSNGK